LQKHAFGHDDDDDAEEVPLLPDAASVRSTTSAGSVAHKNRTTTAADTVVGRGRRRAVDASTTLNADDMLASHGFALNVGTSPAVYLEIAERVRERPTSTTINFVLFSLK